MASNANVTLYVLLSAVVIIVAKVVRLKVNLFDSENKRALEYQRDSLLNFTELSGRYGFSSEEHTVTTGDGYILTIFRLRRRDCDQFKRPPVILMHGLLQSADAWLDAGPHAGLAYLLADACYDLWVGNQRGNYYSRRHVRLEPDKNPKFWQFSVDEIGLYDVPATIDYVLRNTGEEKLNYIGFSQGAGTFLIMCSERPGYCAKANILIALAPATRHTYCKSVPFRKLVEFVSELEATLTSTGFLELFSKGAPVQEFFASVCKLRETSESICGTVLGWLDSFHAGSIAVETLQVLIGHMPAGTSTRNLARYGQSMRTDKFQKYDYGRARNLELYGVEQPPSYNLSAVTVPFACLYGRNDYIVDPKDVFWLVNKLPNVVETQEITDPLWNHIDMTYSRHVKKMVFPKINQYLLKYSRTLADPRDFVRIV